jgi:hypothetical protein
LLRRRIFVTLRLRHRHSWAACVVAGSIAGLTARTALAAPSDAAALKLREQAISTDYLATNFADASGKLQKALGLCKAPADCSPAVRARLLCDLGVIDFVLKRPDDSRAHFTAALKEDPSVTIDADLSSPEIEREFAAAKGAPKGGTAPPTANAGPLSEAARGDMAHTPITNQALLTPIPIYVELPDGVTPAKVIVRYRGPGATEWKTARMTKKGNGYGTEIPCVDVGNSVGELKYFVQALDSSGDMVASSGRLNEPYRVRIVAKLEGEAPHLPDSPAPTACAAGSTATTTAATDCPPGFPGCHAASKSGSTCVSDDECAAGQTCSNGECSGGEGGGDDSSEPAAPPPYKRNWLSIAFQQDALVLPSAGNACAGGSHYTCFRSGGSYYGDIPLNNADDQVNGGITLATSRVLVGYDRALGENVTLGGRIGFAFGGGPQRPGGPSFFPVHLEGRAAYWFGKNALARRGFRFFVVVAGGGSEVDASVPVDVFANNLAAYQSKTEPAVNLRAWKKTGTGFAAAGGGIMYAITPSTGIVLELKAMELFPTSGTALDGQIGFVVGL